jgi:hypothetical protein
LQLIKRNTTEEQTLHEIQDLNDSELVTILSRDSIDYPQGIRIASSEDFTDYGLTSNDDGNLDECGIILGQANTAVPVYISLAGSTKLKCQPLPKILNLGFAWQSGVYLLADIQSRAGIDLRIEALIAGGTTFGIVGKLLADAAVSLGKSIQNTDVDTLHHATLRLIGLGPGLTPSGDDFLCGFIAAAYCKSNVRNNLLLEISQIILSGLTKTNAISATFLRCVIRGEVCSALYNFAKAIRGNVNLEETLKQLCTIGHSSGMDTATGFLYGLKIWSE